MSNCVEIDNDCLGKILEFVKDDATRLAFGSTSTTWYGVFLRTERKPSINIDDSRALEIKDTDDGRLFRDVYVDFVGGSHASISMKAEREDGDDTVRYYGVFRLDFERPSNTFTSVAKLWGYWMSAREFCELIGTASKMDINPRTIRSMLNC